MEYHPQKSSAKLGRYANITLGRWFKRTFGTEPRKRLLQLLLAELIPERTIQSLTYARDEGLAEGRAEGHEALLETARRMLAEGLSVEMAAKCTGLSREDLAGL